MATTVEVPLIPAAALMAWRELQNAIEGLGDPVCRVDPEAWWPDGDREVQNAAAEAACMSCPVQPECLAYAVVAGERWGVWGGLRPSRRRALGRGAA